MAPAKSRATKPAAKREKGARRESTIQVIARAADILRVLADHNGLSLAEIAGHVGLARSTVHRIVLALVEERLVSANGPGQYRLGPEIANLAETSRLDSLRELHPYLVRLSRAVHETVDLSIRTDLTVTFIDQVVAQRRLRAVSALGLAFPLYCTANGKAALAALPDDLLHAVLSGPLEAFTPKTTTDHHQILAQVGEIRRTGIAYDREEYTLGICAVGSALLMKGDEVAAISIPMPAERFYGQENRIAQELARTMQEIARALPAYRLATLKGRDQAPPLRRSRPSSQD